MPSLGLSELTPDFTRICHNLKLRTREPSLRGSGLLPSREFCVTCKPPCFRFPRLLIISSRNIIPSYSVEGWFVEFLK